MKKSFVKLSAAVLFVWATSYGSVSLRADSCYPDGEIWAYYCMVMGGGMEYVDIGGGCLELICHFLGGGAAYSGCC